MAAASVSDLAQRVPCRLKPVHAVYVSFLDASLKPVAQAHGWFGDDEGGGIYPSVKLIARMLGRDEKTVRHARRVLEHLGVLRIEQKGGGRHRPTVYRLDLEVLASLKPGHPLPVFYRRKPGNQVPRLHANTGAYSRVCDFTNPGISHQKRGNLAPETREPVPADRRGIEEGKDQEQSRREQPNVKVLTKLTHTVFEERAGEWDESDLVEEIKIRAAQGRISYDSESVHKAVDSARFQRIMRNCQTMIARKSMKAAAR